MTSFVDSEPELLNQAASEVGFDDFGGDEFREGLRALLQAVDENSTLNAMGHIAIRHMILRDLRARLIAERGFNEFPESADIPIVQPLVIVGLPRTGTTALQELLALDPQFQGLELWLARTPKPRPERASWPSDADYLACDQSIALIREHQPELYAIHKMEADKVDECWNLTAQSFAHSSWLAQTALPRYRDWFARMDMVPVYERHRRNLQLIGANQPGTRWMLKDSTHLFALEAFLEVYPDALVVQTHRDPVESIPSVCSLCWTARKALNDESAAEFGASTLDLWHGGVERTRAFRERRSDEQFIDVAFARFKAEPIAVVEEIYSRFGLTLTDATRETMRQFRSEHLPGATGEHRYAASDWDLDVEEIRTRFADYSKQHGID